VKWVFFPPENYRNCILKYILTFSVISLPIHDSQSLICEHDRALLNELMKKDNLEELGVDEKVILKYFFNKYDVSMD
jgi:hypothetical protein